jgi:ribosomal protein S18 acetylase RimI-like enzyme
LTLIITKKNGVKEGTIEIVGVLQEERREGIGSSLILEGLEWMVAQGMTTVLAYVYTSNKDSLSVFQHLGFEVLSEDVTYRLLIWALEFFKAFEF